MNTMALYLIGDLQGCNEPLQRLLHKIDFSASRDTLYVLGDLVNRGPDSLGVLRSLHSLGDAAQCLLGNHDLNLLGIRHGLRKPHRSDTLQQVLDAPAWPSMNTAGSWCMPACCRSGARNKPWRWPLKWSTRCVAWTSAGF
jgi:hypothetical protein